MNKYEKQLLLKDLCARLPYGIKVLYEGQVKEIQYIEPLYNELKLLEDFSNYTIGIEEIKPYLRPMSSMTEEEKIEYNSHLSGIITGIDAANFMTWVYKHHLDIFHFIEKGLAIEVTEENNPYKE